MGDWSQCSATCGGGVQHRRPLCRESTVGAVPSVIDGTSTIVDEVMCDVTERPEKWSRTCNDDPCPTHWWVGPWQSCPVTCANKVCIESWRRSSSMQCRRNWGESVKEFCFRARERWRGAALCASTDRRWRFRTASATGAPGLWSTLLAGLYQRVSIESGDSCRFTL